MSNDRQQPERLARELRARADQVGGHPLTLDDIKGSATSIRRRQRLVTGGVAAAVLAVAVPFGFALTDRGTDGGTDGTPDAPIATAPTGPVLTDVSFDDLTQGAATEVPYLVEGKMFTAGMATPVGDALAVTRYRGGYVVARNDSQALAMTLSFRDADGVEYLSTAAETVPVASADGTVLTFVEPDGSLVVMPGPEGEIVPLRTDGTSRSKEPVAVLGSEQCVDPEIDEGSGCLVFFNERNGVSFADTHGIVDSVPDYEFGLNGVSPDGEVVVGVTSVDELEPSSCSAARTSDGTTLWETCERTPTLFNEDGTLVIGLPSYLDGPGGSTTAFLDGATGDLIAEFDLGSEGAFTQTAWESPDTLVAMTYFNENGWALLRLHRDGTYERIPTVDLGQTIDDFPTLGQ